MTPEFPPTLAPTFAPAFAPTFPPTPERVETPPSRTPTRPAARPLLGPEALQRLIAPGAAARRTKRLLLYLHVPFCSSKCHFCDWVVGYSKADLIDTGELRSRYVDALCRQIRAYAPRLAALGYEVTNVYWGGGTPTRLAPAQMARIHDTLAEAIDLSRVVEYTAECSPETVTAEHLEVLVERGLNRISAGAQSFDREVLRRMGRAHGPAQIRAALGLFRAAGLANANLDLIAGFPGQSRESLLDSVGEAIDAGIAHLSLYMFREFSTGLVALRQVAHGRVVQASAAARTAVYFEAKALLEAAGYEEYVVGYFARSPAFRFDSEDYYFALRGDYFGFGAGAASVLGHCAVKFGEAQRYGDSDVRRFNDDPLSLAASPIRQLPDSLFTDAYFKAFATRDGIDFQRWRDQFGVDFAALRAARPGIRRWFAGMEAAGAVFVESDHGIALSDETWVRTMIWRR